VGTSGSASSSASIANVNKAASQPSTGSESLTADRVASNCTAQIGGVTRSTSLTNATLCTDSGWDDGDLIDPEPGEHDSVIMSLPASPAPGATYTGHIHLSETSVDYYTVVFNAQVTNPEGARAVNASTSTLGQTPRQHQRPQR
jgi:hypothetical protein